MSSSSKKGHSTPVALSIIRYVVGFIGRFFTHLFGDLVKIFRHSKTAHSGLSGFLGRNIKAPYNHVVLGAIVGVLIIFLGKYILALILLWSALKAI